MKLFITLLCMFAIVNGEAQQKPTDLDKSPMDMSYWPINYPILKMNGKAKDMPVARVIYSRPIKNGRTLFGNIIPYGQVWRVGANEATEIEFFSNVKIAGKPVPKGRYTMYYIAEQNTWTIIINTDNYSWGHFSYKSTKDVVRKVVDLDKGNDIVEAFTMYFEETKTGANLVMLWDDIKTVLPIELVK